ncbi:MAG: carbon-nitrogen hydrolase family protein [Alphaproteobacteria bacterium]
MTASALPRVTVACIQTSSGPEPQENLRQITPLIRQARDRGANFILLPEMVGFIEAGRDRTLARAEPEAQNHVLAHYRDIARSLDVWLLIGSLAVPVGEGRLANRSFLLDSAGNIQAHYDKIHMFDVSLDDGESYRESATYQPGAESVVAQTPWGALGLTVCYDLRFPHLFRRLARAGAAMISVPSAFTRPTGRAHWEVLLRARAIETGCFILAPAQCGEHAGGRQTYGHSLIVGPWGEILAEADEAPGLIMAEIDLGEVEAVRGRIPALTHDRSFT